MKLPVGSRKGFSSMKESRISVDGKDIKREISDAFHTKIKVSVDGDIPGLCNVRDALCRYSRL